MNRINHRMNEAIVPTHHRITTLFNMQWPTQQQQHAGYSLISNNINQQIYKYNTNKHNDNKKEKEKARTGK